MSEGVDLAKLTAPFADADICERPVGGGAKRPYLKGPTVIKRLNDATGNNWSMTVDRFWTENGMNLALVTLTIPGCGSRQHIGIQETGGSQGADAIAKGAITDALKKAAELFGVGLMTADYDEPAAQHMDNGVSTRPAPQTAKQAGGHYQTKPPAAFIGLETVQELGKLADSAGIGTDLLVEKLTEWYGVPVLGELTAEEANDLRGKLEASIRVREKRGKVAA